MNEERFNIIERFGDSDTQDLCAEIRRLRTALNDIAMAPRDGGTSFRCSWMRSRASAALTTETWD